MEAAIDINTDALVEYAAKLESISKSALPVVARQTLNSLAFDVKQTTMPFTSKKEFVQRKKNFFKAKSSVVQAKGFNINGMQSAVGFVGKEQAVEDLEQQERGGRINGRSFISLKSARTGKNNRRPVRANARLGKINRIINARKAKGVISPQEGFTKSAIHAGTGGFIIGDYQGKRYLWKVNSLRRKNRQWKLKLTPLYSVDKGRSVKVKQTKFMEQATKLTMLKANSIFIRHAKNRILRDLKK